MSHFHSALRRMIRGCALSTSLSPGHLNMLKTFSLRLDSFDAIELQTDDLSSDDFLLIHFQSAQTMGRDRFSHSRVTNVISASRREQQQRTL